ncbi:MAG: hypothetical protein SGILL_001668 [Bacillariaceae sp.]
MSSPVENQAEVSQRINNDAAKSNHTSKNGTVPKLGPEPTLLSRKEVDALYDILDAVRGALKELSSQTHRNIDYIVTGGSLLGAIRQHSILFCDDDIDIAILLDENANGASDDGENDRDIYESIIVPHLQGALGNDYVYQIRPWEGGDRIRSKRFNNVFLDLFVIRKYQNMDELLRVIGVKKNGQSQSDTYIEGIVDKLKFAVAQGSKVSIAATEKSDLFPFWHFSTRKALEMWVKEVYKDWELFPLQRDLKFGPLTGIQGPNMPVKLLKRAFGDDCFDVYYQSASHQDSKRAGPSSTPTTNGTNGSTSGVSDLPPLTQAGGTWEGGQKALLQEEHYLPLQPIARAKRRPTLHCKERLMEYLDKQTMKEEKYLKNLQRRKAETHEKTRTIYMDGVFDLFHIGHLEAINQCAKLGNRIIIGVTGDADATGYKRRPIVPQAERVAIVDALSVVAKVICPCPLIVTDAFMKEQDIDLVVHGFANDADAERQREFFEIPMKLGKFQRISYYHGLSTTNRIHDIHSMMEENARDMDDIASHDAEKSHPNPKWFGASLASATYNMPTIPTDPFPLNLRQVIEPHIDKARANRTDALNAIRKATSEEQFDRIVNEFRQKLAVETDFRVSKQDLGCLLNALFESTSQPDGADLSRIHESSDPNAKDRLLCSLTQAPIPFQDAYDNFVRTVCAPRFAALMGDSCDAIFYQAFPCLRIVQPDEFSIGPHADVAYGHHPCSVNFYVPLTKIAGASSLFLESRPGAEDWHSLEGGPGDAKHFAGAMCIHWTTDNKTSLTRASLDFRLLDGSAYNALKCGGKEPGGKADVYRNSGGYYSKCTKHRLDDGSVVWKRTGPMAPPDYRVGFPWTVKSWDKFWRKATEESEKRTAVKNEK